MLKRIDVVQNSPDVSVVVVGTQGPQGIQGPQGATGNTGATGAQGPQGNSAYVYISYADDNAGAGFTNVYNAAKNWIAVKATTAPIASPVAADFSGLWFNYKGQTGATGSAGTNGTDGDDAYVYIAYADDAAGTGFTNTFNSSKDYIAVKATAAPSVSPVAADFAGLWKNYKGATGATGAQGPAGDGINTINALSEKTTPVNADLLILGDSAASFAAKKLTVTNLLALAAASFNPAAMMDISDEFMRNSTTSGAIGELNWTLNTIGGSASGASTDPPDHPGYIQLNTGSTSGNHITMYLPQVKASLGFDMTFIFCIDQTDANFSFKAGLNESLSSTGNNGVWLEKSGADTSFYGAARASSVTTRSAGLLALTTSWVRVRIRRISSSSWGFTVNNLSEATISGSSVSTSALLYPMFTLTTSAAATKTAKLDFFQLKATGMAR